MSQPDERREADELVEPLFAGLSGAKQKSDEAQPPAHAEEPAADPWKHPRPAPVRATQEFDVEREPATFPLAIKAVALMIVLFLLGAVVYMAFGP